MRIRPRGLPLLAVALVLILAGCGGGGPQTPRERLESALDARADTVLDDEGYGNARNVECLTSGLGARFTCTADIPLGPDVFRETYVVTVSGGCWQARQVEFERLTGRDADAGAVPRTLEGCFGS